MKSVLILGASRGIGEAIANLLETTYPGIKVYRASRTSEYYFNVCDENSYKSLAELIPDKSLDMVLSTVGVLHDQDLSPEKSLRDISKEKLLKSFEVNSLQAPLLAKYFEKKLNQQNINYFAILSAKVGSIDDNKMGGWYGYRASKNALNMFLKNIAIEWKRKKFKTCVLSIHPGTTQTQLSAPYIKNTPYKLHSPKESATNIMNVILSKSNEESGSFWSWENKNLTW